MKKSVAGLIAVMFTMILSPSSHAEELEIKSTGGAYQGKFRFKEIDPTDALLEFELAGRTITGVSAGFIGNSNYREVWKFENSFLVYDKLPRRKAFKASAFNEKNAPVRFCGGEVEQNCDVRKVEKLSKNLIVMTYRDRGNGAACAGLTYVGQDHNVRGAGLYGNYNVVVSTCLLFTDDHEQALALSAHYLSLIKKDGRQIAKLSRYNFPKPRASNGEPSRDGTPESAFSLASDSRVCSMATTNGSWQKQHSLQKWVVEAKDRGLSLQDCKSAKN